MRSSVVVLLVFAGFGLADDKPQIIKPADAKTHLNELVTVEMLVESTGKPKSGKMVFLNSNKDFKAENNFAIVIRGKALDEFAKEKIEDVPAHFKGKTIRVTGKVELFEFKPQIAIEEAKMI